MPDILSFLSACTVLVGLYIAGSAAADWLLGRAVYRRSAARQSPAPPDRSWWSV